MRSSSVAALLRLSSLGQDDWETALQEILKLDAEMLGVARVSYWSFRESAIFCELGYVAPRGLFERGAVLEERASPDYFKAIRMVHLLDASDARQDPRTRDLGEYLSSVDVGALLDAPVCSRGKPVGILCHEHVGGTRVWSDSDQEFVLAVGQALAARVEASARGKSEIAAERALLLSGTAARLAKVMAPEAVADAAVHEALTAFADMATVTLFEDATLRLRAAAHATAEGQRALDEVLRRSPARRDAPDFVSRAFVERQSLVIPSVGTSAVSSFAAERGVSESLTASLGVHSAMIVPFMLRGELTGGMTFSSIARVYDQDDLRFAEEYARLIGGNLENALLHEQALRAIRTRDDFLSLASHELSTPLAALRASTGAIAREVEKGSSAEPATLTRLSEVIARQVDRLDRLNDRMLDASELAGGLTMHAGTADLVEIAKRVIHSLASHALRVGSTVTLDADATVVGRWDGPRLQQAISDLLDNAIKFGAGRPIEVGVHGRDGSAVVTVRDHGIGIPGDQLDRIFERYHRAVSARSYGGLGLGLWVVTAIVEAHFGRVGVESRAGEGTTFTVTIPLRGPSSAVPEAA